MHSKEFLLYANIVPQQIIVVKGKEFWGVGGNRV